MINGHEIVLGIIVSPHGTGGLVKVYPYSDFPGRISLLAEVLLEKELSGRLYVVEKGIVHGKYWLVKFKGINSREEAAALRDYLIKIQKDERLPLPSGSYYHDQLVGLLVYSVSGELLGTVEEIRPGGGHDQVLLARAGKDDAYSLIPAVKEFIKQVNLEEGTIVVDLPEGILDL